MTLRVVHALSMLALIALGATSLAACEDQGDSTGEVAADDDEHGLEGAPIEAPFPIEGDLEGLLLVWFDADGPHRATSRDEVPEDRRQYVRVDSLRAGPDERLDPELVYVADVRAPGEDGAYVVRTVRRESFDALVDEAQGVSPLGLLEVSEEMNAPAAALPANGAAEVVIYGADWCPACRASARFFTERGVPFVEKNVEQDAAARAEMNEKARAAGVRPSGIPVIDFRGTILTGFDQGRLEALIAAGG